MLRVRMPLEALLSPCQPPVQELHHFQRHPGSDVPDEPALEVPLQQLGGCGSISDATVKAKSSPHTATMYLSLRFTKTMENTAIVSEPSSSITRA